MSYLHVVGYVFKHVINSFQKNHETTATKILGGAPNKTPDLATLIAGQVQCVKSDTHLQIMIM